jgi:hypothetical protein
MLTDRVQRLQQDVSFYIKIVIWKQFLDCEYTSGGD